MKRLSLLLILLLITAFAAIANTQTDVLKVSRKAVRALKNKDFATLAAMTHPVKGVRISPGEYISPDGHQRFKRAKVASLWSDPKAYQWGLNENSGDPIRMRFSRYYSTYIYDNNYVAAPEIRFDENKPREHTTDSNIPDVYPKAKVVHFHFPETVKDNPMS